MSVNTLRRSRKRPPTEEQHIPALIFSNPTSTITPEIIPSSNKVVINAAKPDYVVSALHDSKTPVRPTSDECFYATFVLKQLHPEIVGSNTDLNKQDLSTCGLQDTIADGIVGTILSQNTTSKNSSQAFAQLKLAFPNWEKVVQETDSMARMEEAIRCGGLSKIKASRIHAMFHTLQQERGSPSFEYLRKFSDAQVKADLLRFPGMGPKTVSCVMLFALNRPEFPVDTHVHRIAKQLGWISSSQNREAAYDHLNQVVPDEVKRDLHCLLIAHGKQCHRCAARGKPQFPPTDGRKLECPLVNVKERATPFLAKRLFKAVKVGSSVV
jgi:endonuclease-3